MAVFQAGQNRLSRSLSIQRSLRRHPSGPRHRASFPGQQLVVTRGLGIPRRYPRRSRRSPRTGRARTLRGLASRFLRSATLVAVSRQPLVHFLLPRRSGFAGFNRRGIVDGTHSWICRFWKCGKLTQDSIPFCRSARAAVAGRGPLLINLPSGHPWHRREKIAEKRECAK